MSSEIDSGRNQDEFWSVKKEFFSDTTRQTKIELLRHSATLIKNSDFLVHTFYEQKSYEQEKCVSKRLTMKSTGKLIW